MMLFVVTFYMPPKLSILFFLTVCTPFILILSCNGVILAAQNENISIGAIVNVNTRVGKEVLIAMKLATQSLNNNSIHQNISFRFYDSCESPLQAAYAAAELIKNDVQAIIATDKWEEAALVADVANRAQVPTISFAPNAAKTSFVPSQWPFLIQMATDINEQIRCIAAIVRSFSWQKVIPIYEADMYGGDSGVFAALSDAIQAFGVDIEYRLVVPPFHSLPDPKEFVQEEVAKLVSKQSRVFIVLQISLSFATHLFTEAKQMGLVGKDSVWILTEGITTLLDSVDTSVVSSMEGALGIKSHFSEDSRSFMEFRHDFRKMFRAEYPEEDNSDIGIYALRAYDSITVLANGIRKLSNSNSTSKDLVQSILTTNFTGLSGNVAFNSGELSRSSTFRIVNFVGKRYRELGFWSSAFGFSDILISEESVDKNKGSSMKVLADLVYWPGHLKRVPKGWSMPTVAKPMKFGVPGETSFEKFVKVDWGASSKENNYSGFCIDVFHEVLQLLKQNYPLPYEFIPYNGTYDDLIDLVANKSFDAIIGDVTILANRSKIVEFTQPFAESGLTMIVPEKSSTEKAWIFLKPFSIEMWGLTAAILIYTVLIVWLLERHSSPEFEGPWQNQLSTALWFTSSSLFFAQREQIHSNYARVAVSVWLFVVLALTSSYTASLSSMLTAPRLEQNVTDIGWLKTNNATVGCDGSSFVRKYLEDVLGFAPVNIKNISKEFNYAREFENGSITAAFLEVPYKNAFLNHHCKGYKAGPSDRYGGDKFGGLGFVFPKGSPIANDVSQGILTLLENGRLKQLESKWFAPSSECRTSPTLEKTESLTWHSFWGLYLLSACTSSLCYLVHVSRRLYEHCHEACNNVYSSIVSFSERLYASGLETLILLHGFSD